MTLNALSIQLRVPVPRINEVVLERRGITTDTALRLSRFFNTTPKFWLNLQTSFDLKQTEMAVGEKIEHEIHPLIVAWIIMSVQKLNQLPSMQDSFFHKEVFGYLKAARFSAQEVAEYLEISMPTFRRYVQSQKINPVEIVGRSQLFASGDLRKFKKSIL